MLCLNSVLYVLADLNHFFLDTSCDKIREVLLGITLGKYKIPTDSCSAQPETQMHQFL